MAQTGFTPIQLYYSSTTTNAPTAGNLANGELAINITDGKLFYKDNGNAVQVIGWKTVPTSAGGTGLTSYTAGDTLYYASGTTLTKLAIGTAYQAFQVNAGATAPSWQPSATSVMTAQGDLLYASGANTLARLAKDANATRYLSNTGTTNNPAWAQINLTNGVTGTLPTANGGTNLTSFTANGVVYASSTSALATSSNLTWNGSVLAVTGRITQSVQTLAGYQWTAWNPSDIVGTATDAPATGTADDSDFVTMANSSGTLTITFDIAGKYLICVQTNTSHANAYNIDRLITNFGGTATRRTNQDAPANSGDSVNDMNFAITVSFYVSATAAQTLTILPTYAVWAGGGTAAQHTGYCSTTILYCGG